MPKPKPSKQNIILIFISKYSDWSYSVRLKDIYKKYDLFLESVVYSEDSGFA